MHSWTLQNVTLLLVRLEDLGTSSIGIFLDFYLLIVQSSIEIEKKLSVKKKSRGNMTLEQLECLQEFKNSAIICNIIFSFFLSFMYLL